MTRWWLSSAPSWVYRPSSLGGCRRSSRHTRARWKRPGRKFTRTCSAPCGRRRPRSRLCSTPLRSNGCTRGWRNVTARSQATRVGNTEEKEANMKHPAFLLIVAALGSDAAWEQVHANHHRAMQEAWTEIETVLDSAQIERLHAWLAVRHGPTSRHAPGQP